ncbi:MAG: hypothetical protein RLZZ383_782 [Pseudomonadota bacterium]|jgi:hypothetical protein
MGTEPEIELGFDEGTELEGDVTVQGVPGTFALLAEIELDGVTYAVLAPEGEEDGLLAARRGEGEQWFPIDDDATLARLQEALDVFTGGDDFADA